MKFIVLIALLYLVQNFWTPQFNQGHQVIVIFSTGHILESQSTVPRQVVIDIQFSIVFKYAPQVFIQTQKVDWHLAMPGGFSERVSYITTTGFKISGIAVGPNPLYELHIYWIAILDLRILVITLETWDVQELKTGTGQREVQYKIEHDLEDATNGIISLMGVKHSSYSSTIEIDIAELTSQYIIVSVRTYSQSQLEFIKLNVLIGTSESLWSSPMQALINAPGHPFVSRGNGNYDLQLTIDCPQISGNYQLIPHVTIRGYEIMNFENIRLTYTNVVLNTKISFTLSTWSTSIIYRVYYQGGIFIYDQNFKFFDPYCAELFSECDFNGDTIIICDKIPDLQAIGWTKPFRSISVPKHRILYLFDQINYRGVKQSVIQTQKCNQFTNILSAQFQPTISFIKVLFLNTIVANNCLTVKFYSQCNYQGTMFQITQGQNLQQSKKIPFEIMSISTCPNIIIKLKAPGGSVKEITTSQACMNSFKFPKYTQNI
ncbi:unnamed protein product [Paramecium primaurelia]|uniref:H-type lectin domain-containing protein n=1 Tax=Paramecium primaurelia TaxID=5886 RepID=A0A8S1MUE8_PARPR|nr:unnamed protein product [Paramecium primaurelia]